jgi:hypothetical protein
MMDDTKMMAGYDNIRFPGPWIDLIHHEVAVNLFQVVDGEEVRGDLPHTVLQTMEE